MNTFLNICKVRHTHTHTHKWTKSHKTRFLISWGLSRVSPLFPRDRDVEKEATAAGLLARSSGTAQVPLLALRDRFLLSQLRLHTQSATSWSLAGRSLSRCISIRMRISNQAFFVTELVKKLGMRNVSDRVLVSYICSASARRV